MKRTATDRTTEQTFVAIGLGVTAIIVLMLGNWMRNEQDAYALRKAREAQVDQWNYEREQNEAAVQTQMELVRQQLR